MDDDQQQHSVENDCAPPSIEEYLRMARALTRCEPCRAGSQAEREAIERWWDSRFDTIYNGYSCHFEQQDREEGHGAEANEFAGIFNTYTATAWFKDGHSETWTFDWIHYCEPPECFPEITVTITRSDSSALVAGFVLLYVAYGDDGWGLVRGPGPEVDVWAAGEVTA
jgi:hypothetical protein